jgi:hypothetical protein
MEKSAFKDYYKYCIDNKINITKWSILKLAKKVANNERLTPAETLAKLFLEETAQYYKRVVNDEIKDNRTNRT